MRDGGEDKEEKKDEEEDIFLHIKFLQFIKCFVPVGAYKLYTSRVLKYW